MLVGDSLLEDMEIPLSELNHRNFAVARETLSRNADQYVIQAEERVGQALRKLFHGRERTLQRLSAVFRRADLVEILTDVADPVSS